MAVEPHAPLSSSRDQLQPARRSHEDVDTATIPLTYLLPLRGGAVRDDLTPYLEALTACVAQVLVVDGSSADVFAGNRRAWPAAVEHVGVDPDIEGAAGKVRGVLTGLRRARHRSLVIADDDVRYRPAQLHVLHHLLQDTDAIVPANHFTSLPWHARWDTARTLVARACHHDMPGTLAVRRDVLLHTGGYDADVLFENLELLRTVEALGRTVTVASWLDVEREPPDTRHFLSQRVRQAYDSFAQPSRLAAELAILPATTVAVRRHGLRSLLILAAGAVAVAEVGRRRQRGWRVHPPTAALWAPLWLAERAVCTWLAMGCRIVLGGVPYGDGRLRRAANSRRQLERRLAGTRCVTSDPSTTA